MRPPAGKQWPGSVRTNACGVRRMEEDPLDQPAGILFLALSSSPSSFGGAHGYCRCRGTGAPQDDQLVRRVRGGACEPELPDYRPRGIRAVAWWLVGGDPVDHLRHPRRAAQLHLLRDGGDVPEALGRHRHLRPRGVEEVLLVRRPGGSVRLLDRLVGGAFGHRRCGGIPGPGPVLPSSATSGVLDRTTSTGCWGSRSTGRSRSR